MQKKRKCDKIFIVSVGFYLDHILKTFNLLICRKTLIKHNKNISEILNNMTFERFVRV